jgi:hypothetical protein
VYGSFLNILLPATSACCRVVRNKCRDHLSIKKRKKEKKERRFLRRTLEINKT